MKVRVDSVDAMPVFGVSTAKRRTSMDSVSVPNEPLVMIFGRS